MITGFNQTVLHPLGLMVLVVSVLAFFYRERQYVFFPFLILLLFVSTLQRVEIAGADFTLLRILLLFTLIRVYFKKEFYWFEFNIIDLIFIFWVTSTSIAQLFTLGNETLVFQIGRLIDVAIPYFLVRFLVRNETDIYQFMKYIVIISLLSVGFFLYEVVTATNLFSIFGGVPEHTQARSGYGALRAQGAFSHPILAGCFWAAALPFAWADYKINKSLKGLISLCSIIVIVWSTSSSTPVISIGIAILGLAFFPFRIHTKWIILGLFLGLIVLSMTLKGPIWSLASKVDVIGGSTGWHRYYLIDEAVNHFYDWWLFGVRSTAHWGWGLWDVTNGFVLAAVRGGLLGLLIYNLLIYFSAYKLLRKVEGNYSFNQIILWSVFISLITDIVSLQGIAFWGPTETIFFIKIAFVSSLIQSHKAIKLSL
ncbi:MAG: hypothetical protein ACI9YH_001200 [Colwellia sp.]|jgi:hypothetical protein